MQQINPNCEFKVIHIAPKMVLFELYPNEYAWASKRIANLILKGNRDNLFLVQEHTLSIPRNLNGGFLECNNYIAIPSTR